VTGLSTSNEQREINRESEIVKRVTLYKKNFLTAVSFFLACFLLQCSFQKVVLWDGDELEALVSIVEATPKKASPSGGTLLITYPYNGSIFPPEIASPTITWTDENPRSRFWLVSLKFEDGHKPVFVLTNQRSWMPEIKTWETIKDHSKEKPAILSVHSLTDRESGIVLSEHAVSMGTSTDPVGDSVFFRQIPIPFAVASKSFEMTRWRMGDISSYEKPATVMKGISACASCHAFS